MTREELEAEVARLRAALVEAGADAKRSTGLQAEREQQHTVDMAAGQRRLEEVDQRTTEVRARAKNAARENDRRMAGVAADLGASQHLVAELRDSQAALRSSEARQRAIFDNAVDIAMVVTDPAGTVTDWNPGAENVLGWTADEMRGQTAERFFTPEDRAGDRIDVEMANALEHGRATDERWHLRKSGERFWASGEMLPLFDSSDVHLGFVKILRDRTREHLDGAALRQAQERFQTIVETIDAAFAIVEVAFDADDRPTNYRFLEANPAFEQQAGVNLRGKWVTEFAPDLERFWFETYGHVAKTGEPANFESYAEAFGRWFDVRAVRVGDPADRQIAILFNDVTARREAQERLRASEAIARENIERVQLALAAGAIIGTWHWDIPTDRFTVDEAFARTFGLDPALGREGIPLEQIVATVHPEDQDGLAAAIDEAIRRGGSYAHQYRVRRADGHYYWIEANGRVDHADDGTATSFPGVLIDVEERRAVAAERDRATADLRALNDTLEQRVADRTAELMEAEERLRQSQKMEAVGQLTGGLAHDFNNLLTAVTGGLDLLKVRIERGQLDQIGRYVDMAQTGAKRAAALTQRLLAFSRRQTLAPSAINADQLVMGMEDIVSRTIGPAIEVKVVGTAGLWPVLVDAPQLENALLNLCINARDAMPDGGRLTIETGNKPLDTRSAAEQDLPPGEYVSLCVSDTGTGMSPETIARIFDPFFTTKPLGAGTGLGLSMIYGFVRQSGGQVRVYSELGEGTTMCLYLPRHVGEIDETGGSLQEQARQHAEAGETVLIVEDEVAIRTLVCEILTDAGYRVLEASTGPAGVRLLQGSERIDLLITDVGLPGGLNGRQVADAGRAVRPDLKVLFVTGYAANAAVGGGHLDKGMAILTKPFNVIELEERVHGMIKEARH